MTPTNEEEKAKMENKSYAQAVWSLLYAMLCTRQDISYVVSFVSIFQIDPRIPH